MYDNKFAIKQGRNLQKSFFALIIEPMFNFLKDRKVILVDTAVVIQVSLGS